MPLRLDGKIALITGGSSGLGLATAKRFVGEGAQVVVTGRSQADLDNAVVEIGRSTLGVRGDVSNLADLDKLYETIRERYGRLDIVFANAGGGAFVTLGEITEEHFDKYFGINVKGTLFTVQKALPLMTNGGAIVLNASMVTIKGLPGFSVYASTKAALRSFARSWAVDLQGKNIRVNVVSPGVVVTPAYKNELRMNDEQIMAFEAEAALKTPLGRSGTPDEIARAVLFLASDDSTYITGAELFVDGGAAQV
ncbi:MAG: glucose 1-dehydrogenase [Phycisphaerae bacterium]|nr:glucose 1-dehydrogenase [Phycisphaerae bacterium]